MKNGFKDNRFLKCCLYDLNPIENSWRILKKIIVNNVLVANINKGMLFWPPCRLFHMKEYKSAENQGMKNIER